MSRNPEISRDFLSDLYHSPLGESSLRRFRPNKNKAKESPEVSDQSSSATEQPKDESGDSHVWMQAVESASHLAKTLEEQLSRERLQYNKNLKSLEIEVSHLRDRLVKEKQLRTRDQRRIDELVAETKGVVGFFTAYRKHVYKSTFDLTENNQRLRTRKFEREVITGDDVERTVHYLDYNSRVQHWFLYKNDKLVKSKLDPIPEGVFFDDILAAFYNFRNGVYGDLGKGKKYKIDTIPDKSMKDISVYIKTDAERKKFNEDQRRKDVEDLLVLKVAVPKDVFKTETGELLFWSSKHFIPLETTIKNYVAFGDLHAKFDKRIYRNSQHASLKSQN